MQMCVINLCGVLPAMAELSEAARTIAAFSSHKQTRCNDVATTSCMFLLYDMNMQVLHADNCIHAFRDTSRVAEGGCPSLTQRNLLISSLHQNPPWCEVIYLEVLWGS